MMGKVVITKRTLPSPEAVSWETVKSRFGLYKPIGYEHIRLLSRIHGVVYLNTDTGNVDVANDSYWKNSTFETVSDETIIIILS